MALILFSRDGSQTRRTNSGRSRKTSAPRLSTSRQQCGPAGCVTMAILCLSGVLATSWARQIGVATCIQRSSDLSRRLMRPSRWIGSKATARRCWSSCGGSFAARARTRRVTRSRLRLRPWAAGPAQRCRTLVIVPQPTMLNIVATFAGSRPGRHLALNGHMDVFPVGAAAGWSQESVGRRTGRPTHLRTWRK